MYTDFVNEFIYMPGVIPFGARYGPSRFFVLLEVIIVLLFMFAVSVH